MSTSDVRVMSRDFMFNTPSKLLLLVETLLIDVVMRLIKLEIEKNKHHLSVVSDTHCK